MRLFSIIFLRIRLNWRALIKSRIPIIEKKIFFFWRNFFFNFFFYNLKKRDFFEDFWSFRQFLTFFFILKLFQQILHLQINLSLFMEKKYRRQCNVIRVENISRRNKNHGTLAKKIFFLVSFWWFLYFRSLLQNPTPKLVTIFFFFSRNHSLDLYLPKSLGP